jgi:hypothetical protein
MKYLFVYLLPAVLFISSCSPNSSNPNTNTGCNVTPVPSTFVEINFNGSTHRVEGFDWDGVKFRPSATIFTFTDPSTLISITASSTIGSICGNLGGQDVISLGFYKAGGATTGNYGSLGSYLAQGQVLCSHSSLMKTYSIDSTLSVNITNITTDYITGTFTCKVKDATSEFPATGSFNVSRFN